MKQLVNTSNSRLANLIFKLLNCLIITLAASSCTQVVQITVPNGTKEVVVDAFIDNSTKPQKVRLTFNDNYFSNVPTSPVLGATVSLNDLTNAKTYTFTPDGNGNYIYTPLPVNDSMAQVGHKYQLNIAYDGNTYIALSTLKRTTKVDTIFFRGTRNDPYGQRPASDTSSPRRFYPFVLAVDIPGPVSDYYWLKVYKNGVWYNQSAQIDVFQDGGNVGFDGQPFIVPAAFLNLTSSDNPIYRNDVCTVDIYSINENTFEFMTQLQSQLSNAQSGLFALTPQNVKTNIQQSSGTLPAIGWFNIGAVSSKSVVAK